MINPLISLLRGVIGTYLAVRRKRKSDLPIALAAAGSSFGVPVMQVNPTAGYAIVLVGAVSGYVAGKVIEKVMEHEEANEPDK